MPKITIDYEKCKDCEFCLKICPMGVFGIENGKVVVKNPDNCIICRACEIHCEGVRVEE